MFYLFKGLLIAEGAACNWLPFLVEMDVLAAIFNYLGEYFNLFRLQCNEKYLLVILFEQETIDIELNEHNYKDLIRLYIVLRRDSWNIMQFGPYIKPCAFTISQLM